VIYFSGKISEQIIHHQYNLNRMSFNDMKKISSLLVAGIGVWLCACTSGSIVQLGDIAQQTKVYEPLFIDFKVDAKVQNPYNPAEIKVDAIVTTPTNETLVLPCFFLPQEGGEGTWEARLTPRQVGKYSLKIAVAQGDKVNESAVKSFETVASDKKGLLSLDSTSHFFMKYDNGKKIRGLGLNVGWVFEPKWNNPDKYTYNMFFDAMEQNKANFVRMWICPWNMPIEWTAVPKYELLVEEFGDWSKAQSHSAGLALSPGKAPECQSDEGQLLKTSTADETLVYKADSVKAVKLMIYYKGEISKNDFEVLVSPDSVNFKPIATELSDSWESAKDWRRIFLFSFDAIAQPANYVKVVLKSSIKPGNIKLAGIQFRYGKEVSRLDCDGLTHYSAKNAQKMDDLVNLAESKGIHFIVTLGYHGQFNPIMDSWGANDEWQRNPYNKKNGGPCETPADFFSNSEAKAAYKNYLRYFVARWGYSDVVAVWEFWNEIDITQRSQKVPMPDFIAWHKEMGDYLKSIDPYKHIVTTSLSWGDNAELWQLPCMDISQVHHYEPSIHFADVTISMTDKYKKPHIIGEYAVDWKGPGFGYTDQQYEEEFHDGMWRGMFSPTPILPLSWWWEYHLDNGQYFHFKPLGTVLEEMEKQTSPFSVMTLTQPNGYQLLGVSSDSLIVVWIKYLDAKCKASFSIAVPHDGGYHVKQMNTLTGAQTETKADATGGALNFNNFDLAGQKDVALLITPIQ